MRAGGINAYLTSSCSRRKYPEANEHNEHAHCVFVLEFIVEANTSYWHSCAWELNNIWAEWIERRNNIEYACDFVAGSLRVDGVGRICTPFHCADLANMAVGFSVTTISWRWAVLALMEAPWADATSCARHIIRKCITFAARRVNHSQKPARFAIRTSAQTLTSMLVTQSRIKLDK